MSLELKASTHLCCHFFGQCLSWDSVWPFQDDVAVTIWCLLWVWIYGLGGLVDGDIYFRTRIILGTILRWFLVFYVHVLRFSRKGSGLHPDLRIQKKLLSFDRAVRVRLSVLMNSWNKFFGTLTSISSDTWVIHSSFILGTAEFRAWLWLGYPFRIPLATAVNFFLFLNVANIKGKVWDSVEHWISFSQ